LLGWFDPFAFGVQARADLNGAEDGVRAGFGLVGVFDQKFGGEAQIIAVTLVEAGGAGVSVHPAEIREIVILLN